MPTIQKSGVGGKVKDGPQSANVREDIGLYQRCMYTETVSCTLYIVHCTFYIVHFTAQNVLYKYICAVFRAVHYRLQLLFYVLSVLCRVNTDFCVLSVLCRLYYLHCTDYIVRYTGAVYC